MNLIARLVLKEWAYGYMPRTYEGMDKKWRCILTLPLEGQDPLYKAVLGSINIDLVTDIADWTTRLEEEGVSYIISDTNAFLFETEEHAKMAIATLILSRYCSMLRGWKEVKL